MKKSGVIIVGLAVAILLLAGCTTKGATGGAYQGLDNRLDKLEGALGVTGLGNGSCWDTDGGLNYFVKGTAYGINGTTWTDYCSSSVLLDEAYCQVNGSVASQRVNCSTFFSTSCINGACANETPGDWCKDSDGGKVYDLKGSVYGFAEGRGNYSFVDTCINQNYLDERYCVGEGFSTTGITCTDYGYKGCQNGECYGSEYNETYCYDSDGGIKPYVKGYVNATEGQHGTDFCNTGVTLVEYYCTGDVGAITLVNCTRGCINSSGVCKAQPPISINMSVSNRTLQ
ncbi:hypothetical protein HYW21_09430 [Candidatus Woesearchaeota archaeon]|nr:hypothetical protein [Candidatus Woesearchaeota archaeon]